MKLGTAFSRLGDTFLMLRSLALSPTPEGMRRFPTERAAALRHVTQAARAAGAQGCLSVSKWRALLVVPKVPKNI